MKACPDCSLEVEDSFVFCPEDGSRLQSTIEPWQNLLKREGDEAADRPQDELIASSSEKSIPVGTGDVLHSENKWATKGDEKPSYRKAAIATGTVLVLLALAGIYSLLTNASRRHVGQTSVTVASQEAESSSLPVIATPAEAQDYTEQAEANSQHERPAERTPPSNAPTRIEQRGADRSGAVQHVE